MIRGILAVGVLFVMTLICGIPSTIVSLLRPKSNFVMRAARLWSRSMLRAVGANVEYRGLERLSASLPCIFVSNHQSNADIWVLMNVIPLSTRFVAKHSLFRIPVLGWALSAAGFIPIDRHNRSRAIHSLEMAAEKIRAGVSVVLFPEGTRSKDGRLASFKKGPFHLALRAGVPIVPVAISGSWELLRPGGIRVRPGTIQVHFLPPVDVRPFGEDHDGLLRTVHRAIHDELNAATEAS